MKKILAEIVMEGVLEREACVTCVSNTRTVRDLTHAYLCISPPNISMMLLRSNSTDPLPLRFLQFCTVFSDNNTSKLKLSHEQQESNLK